MANKNNDLPPAYCSLNETESTENKDDTFSEVVINNNLDNSTEMLIKTETPFESFENDIARMGFIIKVLSIVLMETVASGFIIGTVAASFPSISWEMRRNSSSLKSMASVLHLLTFGALLYCRKARRQRPYNFMFLAALPLTSAFSITVFYGLILYEMAAVSAICIFVVLAQLIYVIFCLNGPLKFRLRNVIFLTAGILGVFYLSMLGFTWYLNPFTLFYLTLLVLLQCSCYMYWLHLMTRNEYHCRLTPSDYVTGALCLDTEPFYVIWRFFKTIVNKICPSTSEE